MLNYVNFLVVTVSALAVYTREEEMMAHTEDMKRLLKKYNGKWNIVGYQWQSNGKIKHHTDLASVRYCASFIQSPEYYIPHDAFENGIKNNYEWWFSGDIIEIPTYYDWNEKKLIENYHYTIESIEKLYRDDTLAKTINTYGIITYSKLISSIHNKEVK